MRRHRTAGLLAAVVLSASMAACSTGTGQTGSPAAPTPAAGAISTAAPAPPAGSAPSRSFAVGVRKLALNRGGNRPLPVTLWYPAQGRPGGEPDTSAAPAAGRYPVVLFSHGLTARPEDYERLLARWASAGFVVTAPAYPHTSRGAAHYDILDVLNQPADASYALTKVLDLDGRQGDPLRGHLATDRVAAAGHSAGGITTVGLFTTARDSRLDAGIVLAGSGLGFGTAFAGTTAPQLFVHGERDDVVAYAAGKAAYDAVPWPKAMLSLPDGDHGGSLLRTDNPAFPVVADSTLDFLRWTLYGDPAAKRRLPGDASGHGLATLDDQL